MVTSNQVIVSTICRYLIYNSNLEWRKRYIWKQIYKLILTLTLEEKTLEMQCEEFTYLKQKNKYTITVLPFRHFTYVTAHSPTLPLLHLRHSSFSNPSLASPTSQTLHLIHLASRPWMLSIEPGFPCKCMFLCKLVTLLKLCKYSFYDLTIPNSHTFFVHVCIFWPFGDQIHE